MLALSCQACGADVSGAEQSPCETYDRVEIPKIEPDVTRVSLHGGTCPCCATRFKAEPPAGLEPGSPPELLSKGGTNIRAFVIYLRAVQGIPLARLRDALLDLFGLTISEGALVNMLAASAAPFKAAVSLIKARLLGGNAGGEHRVALRGERLASVTFRDPDVADRADGIAVDPPRTDAWPPTPLDRVVQSDDNRAARRKRPHQVAEQNAAALPCAPRRPAQHAMEVGEVPVAGVAGDSQHASHRAPPRRQDGANKQHLGIQPGTLDEERGEGDDQRGEAGGQVRHGGVSWRKRRQPGPLACFVQPRPPHSRLAKVELRTYLDRLVLFTHIGWMTTVSSPAGRRSDWADDGFRLPDWLWDQMQALLPPRPKHPLGCHRPRVPDRSAMDAIFFVLRTGCQRNALNNTEICSSSSAHRRFQEWAEAGIFEMFWRKGLLAYDAVKGIDWTWLSLDGAMVKAPLGGEKTGPNPTDRGKRGVKRSVLTDGRGTPIGVAIAGANRNDHLLMRDTLDGLSAERPRPTRRTSIAAPADRLNTSSSHGFASLDRPQRLRALDPPAKSP